jgi:hypothetical protein
MMFVYLTAITAFLLLNTLTKVVDINIEQVLLYTIVSIIFQTPNLLVNFYLAYSFVLSGVLLLGIVNFLTSILFGTTGLGFLIWYFIPSAWGTKFIKTIVPTYFLNNHMSSYFLNLDYILIIGALIAIDLILTLLQVIWFRQWDGKSNVE